MKERMVLPRSISSKNLIGSLVRNLEGEGLGEIDEILVDPQSGFVSNLILSTGKLVGETKRIAIPWDMVKVNEDSQTLILDVDLDFLKRIPAYQGSS